SAGGGGKDMRSLGDGGGPHVLGRRRTREHAPQVRGSVLLVEVGLHTFFTFMSSFRPPGAGGNGTFAPRALFRPTGSRRVPVEQLAQGAAHHRGRMPDDPGEARGCAAEPRRLAPDVG